MKSGLKKLFNKKKQNADSEEITCPIDNYTPMNTDSLFTLPVPELVSIIFKFDLEVKSLNKELSQAREQHQSTKNELSNLQEEFILYKENKDSIQLECNRLAIDLNEALTSQSTTQTQLDLFRTQLCAKEDIINSLKKQVAELEIKNCELQVAGIQFSSPDDAENFKTKILEDTKQEEANRELKLSIQLLEVETGRLTTALIESKDELRLWKEKTNVFENLRRELEENITKLKNEVEDKKNELNRLKFLKESTETENRNLKESINQKEIKIEKKHSKIDSLQAANSDLNQKITFLSYENSQIKLNFSQDLNRIQETYRSEITQKELEFSQKIKELNDQVACCQSTIISNESALAKLSKLEQDNQVLSQELTNSLTENHSQKLRISNLEETLSKTNDDLLASDQKRDLAKKEVLKLSQKIEAIQKSSQLVVSPKRLNTLTAQEVNSIVFLKTELDSLYKTLIGLISEVSQESYIVKIVDFTIFEKKLNNLVMTLHEHLEEINTKPNIPKPKGRTPIKLFSCMAEAEEPPRLLPKPKNPDTRMVLRRGSAH